MEENSRTVAPDLAAAEGCGNELTRRCSDSSSVTVDNSKDFVRRNTNAIPSTAWTDEKHNLYLAALEASFVKQLHHSLGLLSRHSEQKTCDPGPSRQLPIHANSRDQFTVLQDGSGKKINFERIQALPNSAAGPHAAAEIRHFRCSSEHSITSADLQDCNMFCSEGMPLRGKRIFSNRLSSLGRQFVCHKLQQDTVGLVAEVSDQNFVDEDRVEKPSSFSGAKRLKTAAADASTKDQLVPSVTRFTAEISTAENTSSKSEDQVRKVIAVKSFLRERAGMCLEEV